MELHQQLATGYLANTNAAFRGPAIATSRQPATKAALWPRPNYQRLVKDGFSPVRVRIFRFLYEWFPIRACRGVAVPNPDSYYREAVIAFSTAALTWLESSSVSYPTIAKDTLGVVLAQVLAATWGKPSPDPFYFTDRFERSNRGCQLHVILGAASPFRNLPKAAALELMHRQLSRGWPIPRPSYESKGFFVLERSEISIDTRGVVSRAFWPRSSATDRGFLGMFDSENEAQEWFDGLPNYVVVTDRGSTKIISTHSSLVDAEHVAKVRAKAQSVNKQPAIAGGP
jgi:hypothetical protein